MNKPVDSTIVKKIKKLLALANSENENEAKNAAAKAQELLIKHNLNMQEIGAFSDYTKHKITDFSLPHPEELYADTLISAHFFVTSVRTTHSSPFPMPFPDTITVNYIGTDDNVKIASYVRDFLIRAFKEAWEKEQVENNLADESQSSFYFGIYKSLDDKLKKTKEAVEDSTGLIVIRDTALAAKVSELFPNLDGETSSSVYSGDRESEARGGEVGAAMNIRRGIGESNNGGQTLALKR